jgi:hypothetical protein
MLVSPTATRGCVIVLLVLVYNMPANASTEAGIVVDRVGSWESVYSGGATALNVDDRLGFGATVRPRRLETGPHEITLLLWNGNSKTYTATFQLPNAQQAGSLHRIFRLIVGKKRYGWVSTISRGRIFAQDAVLRFDENHLDLSGALEHAPPGRYDLRFYKINNGTKVRPPIVSSLRIDWNKAKPQWPPNQSIRPGVYELAVLDEDGETVEQSCWIVMVNPADYVQASADFAEAKRLTQTWDPECRLRAADGFLHVCLEAIALRESKKAR